MPVLSPEKKLTSFLQLDFQEPQDVRHSVIDAWAAQHYSSSAATPRFMSEDNGLNPEGVAEVLDELAALHGALRRLTLAVIDKHRAADQDVSVLNKLLHETAVIEVFFPIGNDGHFGRLLKPVTVGAINHIARDLLEEWGDALSTEMFARCPACGQLFIKNRKDQVFDTVTCTNRISKRRSREREEKSLSVGVI